MTAIIHTDRLGELRGASVDTIVRHVYGLNVEIKRGTDSGFEWVTEDDGLAAIIVSKVPRAEHFLRSPRPKAVRYTIIDHVTEIEE